MLSVKVVSHNYIGNKHLQGNNELIYTYLPLRYFKKEGKSLKLFLIPRTGEKNGISNHPSQVHSNHPSQIHPSVGH